MQSATLPASSYSINWRKINVGVLFKKTRSVLFSHHSWKDSVQSDFQPQATWGCHHTWPSGDNNVNLFALWDVTALASSDTGTQRNLTLKPSLKKSKADWSPGHSYGTSFMTHRAHGLTNHRAPIRKVLQIHRNVHEDLVFLKILNMSLL